MVQIQHKYDKLHINYKVSMQYQGQSSSCQSFCLHSQEWIKISVGHTPASFLSEKWNVHDRTSQDNARTNNECTGWNNGYRQLIRHSHSGMWTRVEVCKWMLSWATQCWYSPFMNSWNRSEFAMLLQLQMLLYMLCHNQYDGQLPLNAFQRGVGNTVWLC